jgi:ribosomal protein S18 acetylase RimI-like enzyme
MQALTLRQVQDADQDFLFGLYAATRADELRMSGCDPQALGVLLRLQFEAQRQHYVRQYPGAEHAVVEDPHGLLGRCYVHRTAREIRLVDICLLPSARGQGIGTQLLRRLLAEAARAGVPLRLSVALGNPAMRLYQRLGFTETGSDGMYSAFESRATTPQFTPQLLEEQQNGTT